jgi:hypothetical protein
MAFVGVIPHQALSADEDVSAILAAFGFLQFHKANCCYGS